MKLPEALGPCGEKTHEKMGKFEVKIRIPVNEKYMKHIYICKSWKIPLGCVTFVTSPRLGPLVFFVARLPGFGKAANPTVAETFQWRGVSWRDSGGPIGMFRGLAYPDMLEKGGPKNSDVQSLKVSVSPKVLLEGIDFDVGAKNRNTLRYVEMKVCNFNCGRN